MGRGCGGSRGRLSMRRRGTGAVGAGASAPSASAIDLSATVSAWMAIAPPSAEASRTTARSPSGSFAIHPSSNVRARGSRAGPRREPFTRNGARRGRNSSPARRPRSATSCASTPSTWQPCARSRRSRACSIRVRAGRSGGACRVEPGPARARDPCLRRTQPGLIPPKP